MTISVLTGPPMPSNRWGGQTVLDDLGNILLVGGRVNGDFEPNIWAFDEETESWITEDHGQLTTPREYAAIFSVPEEALGC